MKRLHNQKISKDIEKLEDKELWIIVKKYHKKEE